MDDEDSNNVEYQTVKSIRYNYATFSKPGKVTATVKERKIPVTNDILLNEDGSSRSVFVSSRPKIELPTNKILRVKRKPIKTTSEIDAKIRMPPPQFPPPRYRPIIKSHVSLGSPAKLKPTLIPINTEEKAPLSSSSSSSTSSSTTTTVGGTEEATSTNLKFIPFELSKCTPRKISPSDLHSSKPLPPSLLLNNIIGESDSIEFPKTKRICVKTRKIYTNPKKPRLQPVFKFDSTNTSDNNNSSSSSIKSEIPKTISTLRLRKFVNSWALKLGRQCEKDELKAKQNPTNQTGPLIGPYFSLPNQTLFAQQQEQQQQQQFSTFSNNSSKVPTTKASVKDMSAPNYNDNDDAETFTPKKTKMSSESTSNFISSSPSMKRTREECSQDLSDISSPNKKLKTTTIKTETVFETSALDKDGKLTKNEKSKTNKHKKKKKNKLKNKLDKMKKTDSINVHNVADGATTSKIQSTIDDTLSNDTNEKSTKYNAAELKPSSSQPQSPGDSNDRNISSRLLNIRTNLSKLTNGISSQQGTSSDNNNEGQPRWSPQLMKTKLEPSPLVMHTIKLLQQKRELQTKLEDPESNSIVKLTNTENGHMIAPVAHKGELLLNNVPMDAGEVKNVIMKRLAISLAHEGFTHSKLQPLEVLGDVVHDFYLKMTSRLKQIRERELAGVDHGFPDPMERVLVELGMGGVRGLESFYKSKVTNYQERMVDQVNQMRAHIFHN